MKSIYVCNVAGNQPEETLPHPAMDVLPREPEQAKAESTRSKNVEPETDPLDLPTWNWSER